MPAYDYRCERGHRYERREPFGSPRTHDCEKCGQPAQRVLTAPAIAFKGSGWYKTDSRGEEPRGSDKEKSKSSGASSDSSSSNGSSSDAGGSKASKNDKPGKSKAKKADPAKAD
ncbi:MAG: FmdB family zinc ribbon protein [Dehalococcoidia bacterium]